MKVHQLQEILQLNQDNFNTSVEFQVEAVSIYLDLDSEEIFNWPKSRLDEQFKIIKLILNATSTSLDAFSVNEFTFFKLPFTKLSLGAYIDLEYYSSQADGFVKMITILYRQRHQLTSIDEIQYEPYKNWIDERLPLFLNADVSNVIGIKSEYIKWKNNLVEHYKGLFDQVIFEEEESNNELGKINTIKAKKAEEQRRQFSWEHIILKICNGDATKFQECLEMPVILFFNILSSIKTNQAK